MGYKKLLDEIRSCTHCRKHLPLKPRPVLNFHSQSRVLIVGQAPGLAVHNTGVPWNDPSGERLRDWLGISSEDFYDPKKIAIVPMGFCYPGKGKSGDLPPRPECSQLWMENILKQLKNIHLKIIIGAYAQDYFLDKTEETLTQTVKNWKKYAPEFFVLPHPSPRNNIWLKKNPWFEKNLLPQLKNRCQRALKVK